MKKFFKAALIIVLMIAIGHFIIPPIHYYVAEKWILITALHRLDEFREDVLTYSKFTESFLFRLFIVFPIFVGIGIPIIILFGFLSGLEYFHILSVLVSFLISYGLISLTFYIVPRLSYYSIVFVAMAFMKKSRKKGDDLMAKDDDKSFRVMIPMTFDEKQIDYGFKKYKSNEPLLVSYVHGLVERFQRENEIKVIQKRMEFLNISRQYWDLAYEAKMARERYEQVEKELSIKRQEMDLAEDRLKAKRKMISLEVEAEEEELKTRIAKTKFVRENMGKAKEKEKEKTIEEMVNDIKNHSISIVKAKEEIINNFPPDVAEQIIDELERRMVEQDIQKKGRYQSGS